MTDLDQFVNALPDAALVVDRANVVQCVNALTTEVLGINSAGMSVLGFLRSPTLADELDKVRRDGRAYSFDLELRGRPPRQLSVHLSRLSMEGSILILLRDLTREQAIEKMRTDFIANASHEMRTPLASILGTIETLQGSAKNDPKAREMFLQTMLLQAHRMKRLIDDLLTLSRIELNEHVRPSGKVGLLDIARQAKSNLNQQAKDASVKVEVLDEMDAIVSGDSEELLQVAQNLVENAIKYGGAGGRIEMSCNVEGKIGLLSVRDFGAGIAEDHLPRLTERFYRVSTKESRARGGTGLGLAIVKHIVQRHRGRLSITSDPGQGSTFTIAIPLFNS